MNKFSKSVVIGFVVAIALSVLPIDSSSDYLYSAFSFGASAETDDNNDEKFSIVDEDYNVEYEFKFLEILKSLF